MSAISKHTVVVGPFQCNCSILVCEKTKDAVVIDAGDELDRIKAVCAKQGVQVKLSLHTHAHLDHIGAVSGLKAWAPAAQICLHRDDEMLYKNLPMQGNMFGIAYEPPPPVDRYLSHEEVVEFGAQKFSVIHTPGHSPGGVCFRFNEGALGDRPVVFSGDTLFQQSIGRTDLWGGDHRLLIKTIKDRLLSLDGETLVHPGHGDSTTIAAEAQGNPFL